MLNQKVITLKMETKVCPKCSEQKLISEFGVNARLKSGISNVCLECRRVETKLFYENFFLD
jgi:hypothetical protein